MSLIFDEKVIEEHMSKVLHIDMRKMPLGALSAAQLRRGLEVMLIPSEMSLLVTQVLSELSSLLRLDEATKRATHGFDLRIRDATNRWVRACTLVGTCCWSQVLLLGAAHDIQEYGCSGQGEVEHFEEGRKSGKSGALLTVTRVLSGGRCDGSSIHR